MSDSTSSPERAARRRWAVAGALLLIAALSLLPRLPFLLDADGELNSDEAVNALALRHAVEAGELRLYSWDANYYGLFETYLALPFVALFGWRAVAFKLAAVVGFLLLLVFTFLLGRRLADGGEGSVVGIAACAWLTVVSPQVVQWSTLASGGYLLIVAWGSLGLLALDRLRDASSGRVQSVARWFAFGLVVGFGLYIYELYLVYVALFALAGLAAAVAWRHLPGRTLLAHGGALATGFLLGWAPKLAASGSVAGKAPSYRFADAERLMANLELLVTRCIPAFFGVDPAGAPDLGRANGPRVAAGAVLGVVLLVLLAAAWGAAAWRCRGRFAAVLRGRGEALGIEALLVLLVPLTAAAFVVSTNPVNVLSNRYLLPWLSAVPLLVALAAVRLARRWRGLAVAALGLLVALPAAQTASFLERQGLVDEALRPVAAADDVQRLAEYLVAEGIEGGYAPYWVAYRATFLAGEKTVLATFHDWQRHPPYVERVAALDDPVYVFPRGEQREQAFLDRVASAGRVPVLTEVGWQRVYRSADGRPLLPPSTVPPEVLREPLAGFEVPRLPTSVAAGETFEVAIRVENRGTQPWSAAGVGTTGKHRVAATYRWLHPNGRRASPGQRRSLLPADVLPGETLDMIVFVDAPQKPGQLILELTLVQDGVGWFVDSTGSAARMPVEVVSSGSPAPAAGRSPPG